MYVGNENGTVYALETASGGLRWAYTTADPTEASPMVAGGTVYIGSDDGNVYALRAP